MRALFSEGPNEIIVPLKRNDFVFVRNDKHGVQVDFGDQLNILVHFNVHFELRTHPAFQIHGCDRGDHAGHKVDKLFGVLIQKGGEGFVRRVQNQTLDFNCDVIESFSRQVVVRDEILKILIDELVEIGRIERDLDFACRHSHGCAVRQNLGHRV